MAGMFHYKIPKDILQLSNVKLKTINAETTMQLLQYFSESVSENSLRCYDPENLMYTQKIIQFAGGCLTDFFFLYFYPSSSMYTSHHEHT